MDYSKWDNLVDSDDEKTDQRPAPPARVQAVYYLFMDAPRQTAAVGRRCPSDEYATDVQCEYAVDNMRWGHLLRLVGHSEEVWGSFLEGFVVMLEA